MLRNTWYERIRTIDIRVFAAAAATLMLIGGVMWVVPTTPDSNSFTFNGARRGISSARPLAMDTPVNGRIVDGSDADFYRIDSLGKPVRFNLRVTNNSPKLVPAVRVFDAANNLVVERAEEYVRIPGADVDCSFLGEISMTYYVQIASQRNTIGAYTLSASAGHP